MSDRTNQAPAAAENRTSEATPEDGAAPRPTPVVGPRPAPRPAQGGQAFGVKDFLTGEDTRLRDLLAFGMAVEAGRLSGPDGIAELRRKADADLEAHAFRVLHNQAESIRRQAVDDQLARMPRGQSFFGAVLATMVGVALFLAVLVLIWLAAPNLFGEFHAHLAQLAARFRSGS
jgi:hypothetical protein